MDPYEALPLNPKDFLILLALSRDDLHGYGIVKAAEEHSDGKIRFDPANLYRSLKKLERDGLVREADPPTEVGPEDSRRRYYGITEFGRVVVSAEAQRLVKLTQGARASGLIPEAES